MCSNVIQYRLNAFGFLSFGDDDYQSNLGMYDQIFALRWIQENIAAFGGDPDSVTIFGASAGGTSVGVHVVSPLSANLFHKAIGQSSVMARAYIPTCNVVTSNTLIISESLAYFSKT